MSDIVQLPLVQRFFFVGVVNAYTDSDYQTSCAAGTPGLGSPPALDCAAGRRTEPQADPGVRTGGLRQNNADYLLVAIPGSALKCQASTGMAIARRRRK